VLIEYIACPGARIISRVFRRESTGFGEGYKKIRDRIKDLRRVTPGVPGPARSDAGFQVAGGCGG